ncbi:MAG: thiamine diphosphokinase [Ahrensia sp.]|nr:thiamine diphosphokinase [Ahrensia sp.]
MEKKITVLLDGDVTPTDRLIKKLASSYVIAADGGIRHAQKLGLVPNLWVGDFDSANNDDLHAYDHIEKRYHARDKAKSDGELALEEALALRPDEIYICGASGGNRFDHALINVALIHRIALQNPEIRFEICDGTQIILPILPNLPLILDVAKGTIFSIFAFSDLKNLNVSNVKWPLSNANVNFGSTLTLSNETIESAVIHLGDGRAIAIVQDDA